MGISVVGGSTGTAGKTLKVAAFTTPGLSTFTLPDGYDSSNPLTAEILIVGGGGASGTGTGSINSTYTMLAGAGGGGSVWKGTVELTQNMNVNVGRGGGYQALNNGNYYNWHGGNGDTSYVSTGKPKNIFLNPQFLGGTTRQLAQLAAPFSNFDWENTSYYPRFSGGSGTFNTSTYNGRFSSSLIPVQPSTNYCWSMYAYDPNGTQSVTLYLRWFTSDNVYISQASASNTIYNNYGTTGNSIGQIYVGGASPANAAYVMLDFYTGQGSRQPRFSNAMLESGSTTPTTYVDGSTSGYYYAGPTGGAQTFSYSDTTYYAAGGGGGAGFVSNASSTIWGTTVTQIAGHAGGCSGGGGFWMGNTNLDVNKLAVPGHGGGAGGNAIPADAAASTISSSYAELSGLNPHATQGQGSVGKGWSGTSGAFNQGRDSFTLGNPGNSLWGYGKGGYSRSVGGSYVSNNSNTQFMFYEQDGAGSVFTQASRVLSGKPNTGDGADCAFFYSGGTYVHAAGQGGSGLVVIKYWE